jgi:hypothetical protein
LNQIFKPLQAETADIDFAFAVDDLLPRRLAAGKRRFKSSRFKVQGKRSTKKYRGSSPSSRATAVFVERNRFFDFLVLRVRGRTLNIEQGTLNDSG